MSIRQYATTWTALLSILLSLQSCSVKEDRMDCPCYLTIDLSNCATGVQTIVTELNNDYSLKRVVSDKTNEDDSKETYKVKRGLVNVCAFSNLEHMQYHEHKLIIPEGEECDQLMAYSSILECNTDNMQQIIDLHKQYANLRIEFNDGTDIPFTYWIKIKGNYKGLDLMKFSPLSGTFSHSPKAEGEKNNIFNTRVSRQGDDALTLELYKGNHLIDEIPIGKKISAQGYSWTDEDLRDINLKIDFTRAEIQVTVLPWENEKDKHISL